MLTAIKLEGTLLPPADPAVIAPYVPLFSRAEISNMHVWKEEQCIGLGMGTTVTRYNVTLPNKMTISISRREGNEFYGNNISVVTNFIQEYNENKRQRLTLVQSDIDAYNWLMSNVDSLNKSMAYWRAVEAEENVENAKLRAHITIHNVNHYIQTGKHLSDEAKKQLIIEFGYDPEKSWSYE